MNDLALSRRRLVALLGAWPVTTLAARIASAAAPSERIGFIGAGRMGSAIGTLLVKAGHDVMFSSRHPESLKELVDGLGPRAHAGTVADAVRFGDVIVLTIPYTGIPDLAKEHGKALAAKPLIIDVGNPIARRDGDIGTVAAAQGGAGLYLTGLMPGAKVVRAFNAINWAKLPEYATRTGDQRVAAPLVGDDAKAVALAEKLIREIGFEPVKIGGLAMSAHTLPGSPLSDAHSAAEARQIAAGLK